MPEEEMIVKFLVCLECFAKWVQRGVKKPMRCPRCQSRKWDVEANRIDPASLGAAVA